MLQIQTNILYNKRVKRDYFLLGLEAPGIAKQAKPGQFVNIKLGGNEPLLRRPFSIHRLRGANIEILYEVVGRGTEILSQRKVGEYIDIIGPLGNGFNYALCAMRYALPVLVAGGMGIAPLIFLAEKLMERKPQTANRKPQVLLGAKTKEQILCEKEFKQLGCQVKIATEDGSRGFKGYISELLKHLLTTNDQRPTTIYACGPKPMLKEIFRLSKTYNIPAQVSLEEHMACGFGACLGCAVNTRGGFKRVCKEGPVFNADEIKWK